MKAAFERFLLVVLALFCCSAAAQKVESVRCGWYHWDPYQYVDENGKLTGLDYALVKAIFATASIDVDYDANHPDTWQQNQQDVLSGNKDIAAGAFASDYRKKAYHLSRAYRYEWNSLYVRSDMLADFDAYLIDDLIKQLKDKGYRLGVIKGYNYTSSELNQYIAEQSTDKSPLLVEATTEEENFEHLQSQKVDIVVSDRLVGARIIWKHKLGGQLTELPLKLPAKPIHLLIHRSDDPQKDLYYQHLLEVFNKGVEKLNQNGVLDNIVANYLFPVLMNITVQRDWFYYVDILGAVFFALAGFFIARENEYDFFGALVMTALLVAGGGLMRDIIVGRYPVLLRIPDYIYIVMLTCTSGFILSFIHQYFLGKNGRYRQSVERYAHQWDLLRQLIEAIALGAYTIVGVGVVVEMKLAPLWLWGPLIGCLTSCGGGLVANMLRKNEEMKNMRGGLEPECALFWGAFFSAFMMWQTNRLNPDEVFMGVLVTITGCTLTLLMVGRWRLHSPTMKANRSVESTGQTQSVDVVEEQGCQ